MELQAKLCFPCHFEAMFVKLEDKLYLIHQFVSLTYKYLNIWYLGFYLYSSSRENYYSITMLGFPGGSDGKETACNQETQVQSLGGEDPLEKTMATHSSILAWRILWTEEPGRLQSQRSQRGRHDWATNTLTFHMSFDRFYVKFWNRHN